MAKLRKTSDGQAVFTCPGCKQSHAVFVEYPGPNRPVWGWNGSLDAPTLTPSIHIQWNTPKGHKCCHSFVTNGSIQFLDDCTHSLAGQTVNLPELEAQ